MTDLKKVEDILASVRLFLEKELGAPLEAKVSLRLVGPDEIAAPLAVDSASMDSGGFGGALGRFARVWGTQKGSSQSSVTPSSASSDALATRRDETREDRFRNRELGRFIRRGDRFEIRILSGVPESWCWETVAHEFAHAWQSEKNPNLRDHVWIEGFAQWAAERVLVWRGEEEQAQRLRNRKDDYGEAYRAINHLETAIGKRSLIRNLRNHRAIED